MKLLSIFFCVFIFTKPSLTIEKPSIQIQRLRSNFLNFANDFKKESSQCGKDFQVYQNALKEFKPWAALMLDATSKLQSGLASGNIWGLGNFDECLNVNAGRDYNNITGKYCLGFIPIPPEFTSKYNLGQAQYDSKFSVKWGICVPKSCSYIDVKNISTKLLLNTNLSLNFEKDSCYTKDQKYEMNNIDVLAMSIFGTIAVLIVLSTLYEYYTMIFDKSISHPILISFSLHSNCKQLFKVTPVSKESKVIYCFTGIRSLSMAWIIYGHAVLIAAYTPTSNILDELEVLRSPVGQIVAGSRISVDTFFVMSGALVSYMILNKFNEIRFRDIPLMYIHRYLRLTPAFAAMILFQVSLARFLGTGPIWNLAYKLYTQPCFDGWWSSLLYIQNYKKPSEMCLGQTWYLSVDTQLFMLAPFLMILFQKWRKLTYPCLTLLTLATMIYTFTMSFQNKIMAGILNPNTAEHVALIYVATQARGGAYFIGMGLGYFLHDNKGKPLGLSKKTVLFGWIIFFSVTSAIIFGNIHFVQSNYKFDPVADPIFNSFHRIGWSLSIVWLIVACEFGYAGPINKILSWKMMQPLSRLTYSQYLVHASYQMMSRAAYRVPVFLNIFFLTTQFFSDFVMATLGAIILYLAFESPLINVEHIIFKRVKDTKKSESKNNEGNYGFENRNFVFDRDLSTKC